MDTLREREKELACIHHLSRVLTELVPPEETAPVVASAVRSALTDPEQTFVLVQISTSRAWDHGCSSAADGDAPPAEDDPAWSETAYSVPLTTSGGPAGEIRAGYIGTPSPGTPREVLPRHDRELLHTVAALVSDNCERRRIVEELREAIAAESRKAVALEEVLAQVEELRRRNLEDLRTALDMEVLPIVAGLEDLHYGDPGNALLAALREALNRLIQDHSPRGRELRRTLRARLSPREHQIAQLIATGMPTKQIAEALNLSPGTVERHRHSIRRKLGIRNERVNLATFLRSD